MERYRWVIVLSAVFLSVPVLVGAKKDEQRSIAVKNLIDCSREYREPTNIDGIKKQIKEFYYAHQWDKAVVCVVQQAYDVLRKYLPVGRKRLALVVDIDDTALSNAEFIMSNDFGYNPDHTKKWEMQGIDPAIVPIRDLCNFAKKRGFALFFITGRRENERVPTERNLKEVGYKAWNKVYCKPMSFQGDSAVAFKTKWRQHIVSQGYTIIMNLGDQMSDLQGQPQAQANFKLPNPMYLIP